MLSLRGAVLRVWEEQLRELLPRTGALSHPVLIDTMPVLYERMCALLTPAYFGRDGIDVSAIAAEHTVALTGPERRALHLTIDLTVRESIRAFIVAANTLRERFAGALAHDLRQPVSNIAMGRS